MGGCFEYFFVFGVGRFGYPGGQGRQAGLLGFGEAFWRGVLVELSTIQIWSMVGWYAYTGEIT